jgi:hypothetical protein
MKLSVKNLIIAAAIGLIFPAFAWAMPSMPHQFYGTVVFSNGSSPDGLLVEARVDGESMQSTVTKNGKYGYDPLFKVEDNESSLSGKTVRFFVGGIDTNSSITFKNGDASNVNLTVPGTAGTITKEANDVITNQTVTITPTTPTVINMGTSLSVNVASTASATTTIEKVEKLQNNFFSGAAAVISGNNVLNAYEIKIKGTGLAISVTMHYDDANIDENTIKPYRFNGTNWVAIIPFTRDTSANTLTFSIAAAATPYAIFGSPAATPPSSGGGGGGGGGGYVPPVSNTLSAGAQKVDFNKDNKIDILDFNALMVNWGEASLFDFNLLMINWTI